MLQSLKKIFAGDQILNLKTENKEIDILSGLMIEAANTDGEVTQEELNKISHSLINVFEEDPKVVEESLTKAGLWNEVKDRLHKPAFDLSGGQQQRLCIARTIALKPDVILMDEPTSALDPIATKRVEELIREIRENYTIVIVTHSMQQAARISDYTAFFYMGKMIECNETSKIFTDPSEDLTQDYITGRMG